MRIGYVLGGSLSIYLGVIAVASCSGPQPQPFRPMSDVKLLMDAVVDPQADVIWNSVKTTISAVGIDERRPRTSEEWTAVRNSAVMLAESGNLLMMSPRAYDGGDWMKLSQALVDVGVTAARAADARNANALFDVGEHIDNACEECHRLYAYEDAPRRKR